MEKKNHLIKKMQVDIILGEYGTQETDLTLPSPLLHLPDSLLALPVCALTTCWETGSSCWDWVGDFIQLLSLQDRRFWME